MQNFSQMLKEKIRLKNFFLLKSSKKLVLESRAFLKNQTFGLKKNFSEGGVGKLKLYKCRVCSRK